MRLSVVTTCDKPAHLDDAYQSLTAQSLPDWEWVVYLYGGARWSPAEPDERVRVTSARGQVRTGGLARREAVALTTGDVVVELGQADLLTSHALALVLDAFSRHRGAALVYSDFASVLPDGSPSQVRFDESMGWTYSAETVSGTTYERCHSMAATPHNVGYVWYAPHHVRAFRRTTYDEVGGYDADYEVLEDHELMTRLYLAGDFVHIPSCLYLERSVAPTAASERRAERVAEGTVEIYQATIESMSLAWAARSGLAAVALRTPTSLHIEGIDERYTWVTIDPARPRLSYADDSVGVTKAVDILPRMPDRAAFLNECYRALPHAGLLLTDSPSTDGRGAFADPANVAFYNENSFIYLTQAAMRPTIPTLTARLQVSHLQGYFPSEIHEQLDIPYIKANLLAVKDGPRQAGPLLC